MTVAVITDSNTMIPVELTRRLGITVVPLSVIIGGDELVEDDQLDLADAYRRLRAGEPATTSAPSPGSFAAVYEEVGPGTPIASIHIGATYSGTINAARVGAETAGADVHIVDTGTASFLAGCCVLAAAEAAASGAAIDETVAASERTSLSVASVFTIVEVGRASAGGRLGHHSGDTTPVLLMHGADIRPLGSASSADEAANVMFEHVRTIEDPLRIGIGDADAGPLVDELVARLRDARPGDEVIRYTVGPSVAAHAGMGTFGVVFHPR